LILPEIRASRKWDGADPPIFQFWKRTPVNRFLASNVYIYVFTKQIGAKRGILSSYHFEWRVSKTCNGKGMEIVQ
jgi:hypothetical protein